MINIASVSPLGEIVAYSDTSAGSGYTTGIKNTSGGTGTGCQINITSITKIPTAIAINTGGVGHQIENGLVCSGGSGTGFKVNIVDVTNAAISAIELTSPGDGYFVANSLMLAGGNGAGATCDINYVYLADDYYYFSTIAPVGRFVALGTLDSTGVNPDAHDSVCIGYITVTSENTMSGNWNLWSIYHQPEQNWSTVITNTETVSLLMSGLIKPTPDVDLELSRTGSTRAKLLPVSWDCFTNFISIGSDTQYVSYDPVYACGVFGGGLFSINNYFSDVPDTQIVTSSVYLRQVLNHVGIVKNGGSVVLDGATGNFTLTRRVPVWPIIL
jgi:hypothetical protein